MSDVLIKEWDVGAIRRPATLAPSASRTPGANFPWDALNFSPSIFEHVFMFGTMPESDLYTVGQNIKVEISWISDAASVGVTSWIAYLLGREAGEAWDVAFTNSRSGDSPRTAGNALHVLVFAFAAPTLSPGDDFILRIARNAAHANDNYPVDADLVRVRMYAA